MFDNLNNTLNNATSELKDIKKLLQSNNELLQKILQKP